ncbi:MAG TPA: phosphohistidine phosphatase SixA [Gemmataceae bacterium]|nr:phosphohistidine phosphatase SixA [Gemmataceae bacterium]
MDLYVIRHADAAPLGEGGIATDADRPLTKKGQDQAKQLASGLSARRIRLGVVLTSPLRRALETAERMLQEWPNPAPQLRVCQELAPGGKRRKLSRVVSELGSDTVALVGHQPDLGRYIAWLIGSKKTQLDLAKAGVAHVVCEKDLGKGEGALALLVAPEWLGISPTAST